jgi:hypothetical protein
VHPSRDLDLDNASQRSKVIDLRCVRERRCRHRMYLVVLHKEPLKGDDGARLSAVKEASRAQQHAATSQVQYLGEHIRFINHQGKQILLIDLSNCSSAEVEKIFRAVPEFVTTRRRGSVLILSDFRGASIDPEAIRIMQETAVFDKPYVKKSAWTGEENFLRGLCKNLGNFSRREFHVFQTREEALAWLAKD